MEMPQVTLCTKQMTHILMALNHLLKHALNKHSMYPCTSSKNVFPRCDPQIWLPTRISWELLPYEILIPGEPTLLSSLSTNKEWSFSNSIFVDI